jgi:hypothetical protein
VGSSSSSRSVCWASAIAIHARWRWPPESSSTGRWAIATLLGASSAAATACTSRVLDADHDRLARLAGAVLLGALPGRPVPGPVELRDRERVDVQQRARLSPLKALGGLRARTASAA